MYTYICIYMCLYIYIIGWSDTNGSGIPRIFVNKEGRKINVFFHIYSKSLWNTSDRYMYIMRNKRMDIYNLESNNYDYQYKNVQRLAKIISIRLTFSVCYHVDLHDYPPLPLLIIFNKIRSTLKSANSMCCINKSPQRDKSYEILNNIKY